MIDSDMNAEFIALTKNLNTTTPLDLVDFQRVVSSANVLMPEDYLSFMKDSNGAEGIVGEGYYLQLWGLDELEKINTDYSVNEFANGYFVFGTNGSGKAFAFKKSTGQIFSFDFVGMLIDSEPEFCGNNFREFLKKLVSE